MAKTEVYSWRVSPHMKRVLEEAARRERQSVSGFLERIVAKSLRTGVHGWRKDEAALQDRLHTSAMKAIGKIRSGRPGRSARVRELVRKKLRCHHARTRPH
jgi:hypothetical protein